MRKRVIVIGAGGAGIIAAWRAAELGAEVVLLERNRKPGIKILISGGGRCNVTHSGPVEDLLSCFSRREARFLKPSIYRFTNDEVIRLLDKADVPTVTRANGRVFPASGNADDVLFALLALHRGLPIELRLQTRVLGIRHESSGVTGVECERDFLPADSVVVATGGVSYPQTGTTGDGIRWAGDLGHRIVTPAPALAPIGVVPTLPQDWRGVSVRNARLSLRAMSGIVASKTGDFMFSHEGLTGPAALELSGIAAVAGKSENVDIIADLFPESDFALLDAGLLEAIERHRNRRIATLLEGWLPNRIVPSLLSAAGVAPENRGHIMTRSARRSLVGTLKEWRLGSVGHIAIERGEVSAGGVSLDDVDPRTMASRRIRGLYFAGEVLDIAGPIGGYNLQAAFSTGFTAGENAVLGNSPGQGRVMTSTPKVTEPS